MGELAGVTENVSAALSGGEGTRYSGDHGRRRNAGPHRVREFLGEVRPGGRNRGGAGVPGCVCAPGTEENLTCGDHAPRIRLRVLRRGEVLQCIRSARSAYG